MSVYENVVTFWKNFSLEEDRLIQALASKDYETLGDILELLNEEVYRISGARFFVEDTADDLEMTFDAGPNKTSQYITALLKKLAPEDVKHKWIINDVLPPLSQKAIEVQVQMKDQTYTLTDFHVFYTVHEQSQTISALLYCPGFSSIGNPEYKKEMAMYLIETAIGQLYYEAYLSSIDAIDTPPKEEMKFCSLVDFFETIDQIVLKNHWKEYKSPLDIYSVYQPHQDIASDSLRKDMKIIFTTHPLLAEESLGESNDVSLDLKAKDGEYGYMYYSNPLEGKDNALFRQELSKNLDEKISSQHAGKVIGGAMGKSYSYIDWIVYDKDRFMKIFDQLKDQLEDVVDIHYRSFEDKK
jgi:hypothetical protein